jgi:hypothetical protein
MANVLGTLFGDIANAIRSKTGNTGKMSPADFPAQIEAIQTGSSDFEWIVTSGTFTSAASGTDVIVEHNLGVVPDMFLLRHPTWIIESTKSQYSDTVMLLGMAFKSDLASAMKDASGSTSNQFSAIGNAQSVNMMSNTQNGDRDLDATSTGDVAFNATETTVTVKGTFLHTGKQFVWYAIGHK